MPSALWPAFPDVTLANPNLPLGTRGKPQPTKPSVSGDAAAYECVSISRGNHSDPRTSCTRVAAAAATVQQTGGTDPAYITAADGQFVLFLSNPPGLPLAGDSQCDSCRSGGGSTPRHCDSRINRFSNDQHVSCTSDDN